VAVLPRVSVLLVASFKTLCCVAVMFHVCTKFVRTAEVEDLAIKFLYSNDSLADVSVHW